MQISDVCQSIRLSRRFRDDADADAPTGMTEGRDQRRALAGASENKNVALAIRSSVHQDGAHRIDRG